MGACETRKCVCLLRFESWELCSWRRESEFGLEGEEEGWRGLYRGDEHEMSCEGNWGAMRVKPQIISLNFLSKNYIVRSNIIMLYIYIILA